MNIRQLEELIKIEKLKKEEGSFVCDIVIPKDFYKNNKEPMSILYGDTGSAEIAMMLKTLKAAVKSLEQNFPEIKGIEPFLGNMREDYKEIITKRGI